MTAYRFDADVIRDGLKLATNVLDLQDLDDDRQRFLWIHYMPGDDGAGIVSHTQIVATDGHRIQATAHRAHLPHPTVMVMGSSLRALRLLAPMADRIEFGVGDPERVEKGAGVLYDRGALVLSSPGVVTTIATAEEPIDWTRTVRQGKPKTVIRCSRTDLAKRLDSTLTMRRQSPGPAPSVLLHAGDPTEDGDSVTYVAEDPVNGGPLIGAPVGIDDSTFTGDPIEVAVRARYLREAITPRTSKHVQIEIWDPLGPLRIAMANRVTWLMPMRKATPMRAFAKRGSL